MGGPQPGAGNPGPQVFSVPTVEDDNGVIQVMVTPPGVATTLVSLAIIMHLTAGFDAPSPPDNVILLQMFSQSQQQLYAHGVRCPVAGLTPDDLFYLTLTAAYDFTNPFVETAEIDSFLQAAAFPSEQKVWIRNESIAPITLPPNAVINLTFWPWEGDHVTREWLSIIGRADFTGASSGDAGSNIPLLTPVLLEEQIATIGG